MFRIILGLLGTIVLLPLQILWALPFIIFRLHPRYQSPLVRLWHKYMLWVLAIKVTVVNKRNLVKKQKLFLSNHVSYMDIPVLGAYFDFFFVAKSDIAGWPIFGFLSKVAGTLFITRERRFVKKQLELLSDHLKAKQSLLVFPEGTTHNGQQILPFKSSLLNSVVTQKTKPLIQSLSIVYTHINKKKLVTQEDFDKVAWYTDVSMGSHFWNLLCQRSIWVKVIIHPAIHIQDDSTAKSLALDSYHLVKSVFNSAS